jgi:phage major head subunit gpT-like protein
MPTIQMPWQQLAMQVNMDEKAIDLVDLGAVPMPVERKGPFTLQDMIEKTIEITPRDWDITIGISYNAVQDDQTGDLLRKARNATRNFQRHINNRVFTVLNGGDGTTYGLCYDGQEFFDTDHVDAGAAYQTNQDNEYDLALSIDNFETVWVAAQGFKDDQGEEMGYNYDLLVVSPGNFREAQNIIKNEWAHDTANREINPFQGILKPPVTSPKLDSSAWFLIASSEEIKPLIVAMREQPGLQTAWFDPVAGSGGMYYFKFYGRYDVFYGDWRLAVMGDS